MSYGSYSHASRAYGSKKAGAGGLIIKITSKIAGILLTTLSKLIAPQKSSKTPLVTRSTKPLTITTLGKHITPTGLDKIIVK